MLGSTNNVLAPFASFNTVEFVTPLTFLLFLNVSEGNMKIEFAVNTEDFKNVIPPGLVNIRDVLSKNPISVPPLPNERVL